MVGQSPIIVYPSDITDVHSNFVESNLFHQFHMKTVCYRFINYHNSVLEDKEVREMGSGWSKS